MKKIISINLSGRVILIEDSAFEKLQSYLDSLRRYFAKEEGRDEIINDIESRIAELMNDKTRKGATAIAEEDVEEIVASMGRPEDFDPVDTEEPASATPRVERLQGPRRRRLYRDSSDKILGGVCAGIANYLNVDPAIIRLLFAIITFGGFGFGILIYILLWIVLPAGDLEEYAGKRLYRNPDDRVFGGVASGLAAYFGREAWLIRLIFAAPLLLNILVGMFSWPFFHEGSFVTNMIFGSVSGTFIVAYIVLWIVLPEARSQYQKMEMRGEKVDVNRIRRNVREGLGTMKEKVKNWGEEVRDSAREFNTRGKAFATEVREAGQRTGRGLGHVLGVLFRVFFIFLAGTIAFALFVALLGLIVGGVGVWPLKNFLLEGFWQNTFAWGILLFFLGIPLVAFITWLIRRIMRVRSQHSYLGWIFGGLWALGWVSLALFAGSMVNDFRRDNSRYRGTELPIIQPANGKMIVRVSGPEVLYSGDFPWIEIDGEGVDITRDSLKLANVRVRVEQSNDSAYHVEIKKYSRGRTAADAEARAQQISFNASYTDSVLDIGSGIGIGRESRFRGQQAVVIVRIPTGKRIRFDESLDKLHALDVRISEKRRWRENRFDIDFDEHFNYRSNVDYVMGVDGVLRDEWGNRASESYRYRPAGDSISIEQQRRKVEEEQRKLREMEEKRKTMRRKREFRTPADTGKAWASSRSAVFSLVDSWN
ncbi:MAG TPA: PspC domain-containing protein [Chitinophagaceae bacterium]|nr:PspC domain-containing protein [Chitinophagaceae bacterium]